VLYELRDDLDETQTIVLDGTHGATIKWVHLEPVAYLKRPSFLQWLARFLVRRLSGWLFFGLLTTIIGGSLYNSGLPMVREFDNTFLGIRLPFVIVCGIAIPWLPYTVRRLYAGKLWSTQATFLRVIGIPSFLMCRALHRRLRPGTSHVEHSQQHSQQHPVHSKDGEQDWRTTTAESD
jgi:hypothetical protein